jgi:hypothetical protein
MALTSNRINVAELDFDNIKENLKNFLRGQDQFKDYDFDGAGLNILLDVLAYNTHYNNLYTNLAVNEMFLDSAAKRSSVVSLAKMLGYVPRSATCARATVDLRIINPTSSPTVTTLPGYQPFTTSVDGQTYTFYNLGDYTTSNSANGYVFSGVELVEGTPLSYSYTVTDGARYIIPNSNVDLTTVRVTVQDSASMGNFTTYNYSNNILTALDPNTKVFFVKEIEGNLFEIYFGDGTLGAQLVNGNVVNIEYFVSNLDGPNGARLFNYTGISLLGGSTNISTKVIATGGGMPEDLESIRYNAPRSYAAQNRAVTPDDYKALILSGFSEARSVSVWGGEVNYPAVYGKVYICVLPTDADKLTNLQKTYILTQILQKRNMVSVTPEIIDPEYINIALTVTAYYNPVLTKKTANQLQQIVTDTIVNYNNSDLRRFDGVFRHSKLSRLIDTADRAIVNSNITVLLRRKLVVKYNTSAQYILNIINPLYSSGQADNSIYSTGFFIKGSTDVHYLDDDGLGSIRLYTLDNNYQKIISNTSIGTVNYDTGYIQISNLYITALADVDFEISMKPRSNDVVSALHQVAEFGLDHLTVNMIADQSASGDLSAGFNYKFTDLRPA